MADQIDKVRDIVGSGSDPVDALLQSLTRTKAELMLASLTERETQVMEGLARFKTRKQVARDLDISEVRVGQLTATAKKRLGVTDRADAISGFIIARSLCEKPLYTEKHLNKGNEIIDQFVADGRIEELFELLRSPDFKQFMMDLRSNGPWALSAKYGPWWKIAAGLIVAVMLLVAVERGFAVKNEMNETFASEPSNP